MNPEIEIISKAIDFYPLQKTWIKALAVNMDKSLLTQKKRLQPMPLCPTDKYMFKVNNKKTRLIC